MDKSQAEKEAERKEAMEQRIRVVRRLMNPQTYGIEPGGMKDPGKVRDALIALRSAGVNLLGPETHLDVLPPSYVISFRFLMIDPYVPEMRGIEGKRSNGYWYEQKGGGLSLTYVSLNQLAHLAGLKWLEFDRVDDGKTPLYWRYYGRATVRYFDGTIVTEPGTGEADLRDGSAETVGVSDKQLAGMRAKGSQRGESIAKAGLIRKMLALRGSYSWEEAPQPFVWPALVYIPPTDDAELNRAIAFHEMGLTASVFGPSAPTRTVLEGNASEVQAPRGLPAPPIVDSNLVREVRAMRERGEAEREKVPVSGASAPTETRGRGSRGPAPEPDDGFFEEPPAEGGDFPWDKKKGSPAPDAPANPTLSPETWAPFTLIDLVSYCKESGWKDPRDMSETERASFLSYVRGSGAADVEAFVKNLKAKR